MMLSVAASLSGLMRLFVGWNGLPAPAAGQLYVGQKVPAPSLLKFHSHNDCEHITCFLLFQAD
jgi:hypothetical protein